MKRSDSPVSPGWFHNITGPAMLFLWLLLAGFESSGQAYFYFENRIGYPNDSVVSYYTFLTLYNNGSGIARTRFKDPVSGENRLFETALLDSAGTDPTKRRFLVQRGEVLPIEGTPGRLYVPPKYVFEKYEEAGETYFKPAAWAYQWPDGSWHYSEMLVNAQKTRADLQRDADLVTFFFSAGDLFYQSLFLMRSGSPNQRKEKLHLIAVANTRDTTLGSSTRRDLDNIVGMFTRIANGLDMEIRVRKIADADFTKTAVEIAIAQLQPAPSDIVVFYYSGHGFRYSNDASLYPRMSFRTQPFADLAKNNMSVEGVYKALLRKKAKVTLVLSDCCNEDIGSPVPMVEEFLRVKAPPGRPPLNISLCKKLFFPEKPVGIIIGSADKNQLAVCTDKLGGYFTNAFKVELEKRLFELSPADITWRTILAASRQQAFELSLGADCNRNERGADAKVQPCVQKARFVVSQ
ncbi:hypothetical protein GCM10010967_11720 [Dyadobacter beijingensis]|uniref:Peptidase C14 caspase domain-containing protein n=1 Tax=Dyadobacter beijingensis TaxID=365489 RepID=A0ABQ2HKX3_9BACT|nr:caspase family protein [Dyadobacter beijingensis]GGM81576.1 hypothetical protein GCM10010967_11720 [Dyadobacter beijingensis]